MSRACFSSVSVYCVLSYCRVRSCKREAYYSLNGRIQSCLTCSLHDTRELPLMIIRLPAGVSSRRSGPRSGAIIGLCAAVSALPLAAGSSAPDDSRPTPTPDSERQCRAMHAADRVVPWHRYDHTRTHLAFVHARRHHRAANGREDPPPVAARSLSTTRTRPTTRHNAPKERSALMRSREEAAGP